MTIWSAKYRLIIIAGAGIVAVVLAIMLTNILSQLSDLATADGDNPQWSISQLDAEFANLNLVLVNQLRGEKLAQDRLRLRIDIALSRLGVLNSGRAARLFFESDAAREVVTSINEFADEAAAIVDGSPALTDREVGELKALTEEVRPLVRKIALLGLTLGAEQSQVRREDFSRQLKVTGTTAIGLLIVMAVLLAVLERLLQRARERDAALLSSSQRLASTVAASLDAILTADASGRITEYNEAAEEVFGWTRSEILGRKMDDTIIPPRHRRAHLDGMQHHLETGNTRAIDAGRLEMTALRKSGEEFPVELNITSVKGKDAPKFIAYLRDISARKIAEQNLIDAKERAETADRAKSRFLTVMSHEMRTPLNGILGVLDLLKTTNLSDKQARYTKIAAASGEILLEHINEALDATRIESGEIAFNTHRFELAKLISGLFDVLGPLADEKKLELIFTIDPDVDTTLRGDASRIRQIITNLLGNAIKFTETGQVEVRAHATHHTAMTMVTVEVIDTGPGIKPDDLELIFDDFVALAQPRGRQSRGDGLGLSISRRIARQMGGDLKVESTFGEGTTFTLSLPLTRAEDAVDGSTVDEMIGPFLPSGGQPLNILVVEDNDVNRRVLRDMLDGLGHKTSVAVDGVECLGIAAEQDFDLIFMDVSMPNMDGIEATTRLRQAGERNQKSMIVGLTAHGQEEYRAQAEAAGMDAFYTKPIRLATLQSILRGEFRVKTDTPPVLEASAIDELCGALGAEKIKETGAQFFEEFDHMIRDLGTKKFKVNGGDAKQEAHRLKGAAALLGLRALEGALAGLEGAVSSDAPNNLAQQVQDLIAVRDVAHQNFYDQLASEERSRDTA